MHVAEASVKPFVHPSGVAAGVEEDSCDQDRNAYRR